MELGPEIGKPWMSYLNLINVARCDFCFNYPSIWLFLPFQTWNKWEPESEISVISIHESSANTLQVLSVCVMCLWGFRQGYLVGWFMECLGLPHTGQLLWISCTSGDSPAADSAGSF